MATVYRTGDDYFIKEVKGAADGAEADEVGSTTVLSPTSPALLGMRVSGSREVLRRASRLEHAAQVVELEVGEKAFCPTLARRSTHERPPAPARWSKR